MRCIDADALEELFREVIGGIAKKPEINGNLEHMVRASAMVIEMIQDAPTIEPRNKGHWIKISPANIYECSECGKNVMTDDISAYDFCHGCGADMTEESEEPKQCDTCKHEKSRWFSRCADCSDYELWEEKNETGRSTTED